MNKKGSVFFGLAIGLFIFAAGILILPFFVDTIVSVRELLDCSSTSITGGTMITCLQIDLIIPYLIWFVTSLALGYLIGGTQ